MRDINRLFELPLGLNMLSGRFRMIDPFSAASLGLGVMGSLFGGAKARKAAKKAERENRFRTNAEKAWYDKEYNTNYLDTKAGQNLLRKAQDVQDRYIRKADGAAAVGGGTAASSAMAKEAANRVMGDTMANIGAQDTARKAQVSDRHLGNVQALSQERSAIANQKAASVTDAAQGMSNAMIAAAPGLASNENPGYNAIDVKSDAAKAAAGGSLVPKVDENALLLKKATGV